MNARKRRPPSNFMHLNFLAWGAWHIARQVTEPGWSKMNAIARAGASGSRPVPGHRILAPEMGPDVQRVQRGVMALSEKLREAVTLKYCTAANHSDEQHARALGIKLLAFRKRLIRARQEVRNSQFA